MGQMFIIPSSSMENTLLIGDRVVVEKITDFKRGDVVVFADPGGWLSSTETLERGPIGQFFEFVGVLPDTGTEHLIKRVIWRWRSRRVLRHARAHHGQRPRPARSQLPLQGPDGERMNPSDVRFEVVVPKDRGLRHGRSSLRERGFPMPFVRPVDQRASG